mgnify:CR=1 FL=1
MDKTDTPLGAVIQQKIAAAGPLRFREFMALCLYHPRHGYYTSPASPFGAAGDFVTAPELGPLFGRALARGLWPLIDSFGHYEIVEIGAGSGRLARDLIRALAAAGRLPVRYRIDEISPALRRRQAELFAGLPAELRSRIAWEGGGAVSDLPHLVIANEVLDALPVSRVVRRGAAWLELGVVLAGDRFAWCELSPDPATAERLAALDAAVDFDWPDGYLSEVHPAIAPALAQWTAGWRPGALILVDYGYPRREFYLPERAMGTLLCHRRHRVHDDALYAPGAQDLTAFVDFTTVAEAATVLGLEVLAYTSQAEFLLAAGILDELAADAERPAEARRLLLPGEMGERFQVMALGREIDPALLPPAADWRHRL